jgi:hypothetical protein
MGRGFSPAHLISTLKTPTCASQGFLSFRFKREDFLGLKHSHGCANCYGVGLFCFCDSHSSKTSARAFAAFSRNCGLLKRRASWRLEMKANSIKTAGTDDQTKTAKGSVFVPRFRNPSFSLSRF